MTPGQTNDSASLERTRLLSNESGYLCPHLANRVLVEPPSSVGVSGTIYLWGLSYCVDVTGAHAGTITDDNGKEILTVVATSNGPYFLQLSTPIQITANSGLKWVNLTGSTTSYCTPLYVTTRLNFE